MKRRDIQGNIVRGYARHCHCAYLLTAVADPAQARALIKRLIDDHRIATERNWRAHPAALLNVAFTYRGLERLYPHLDAFAPYEDFRQGMYARGRRYVGDLGDNDPDNWDAVLGKGEETHALFTVYGDSEGTRDAAANALAAELQGQGFAVVHDQRADMLERNREHFGFTDGFSQPALRGVAETRRSRSGEGVQHGMLRRVWEGEWRNVRLGEFVLGYEDEDGVISGEDEPLLRNGTFMVWRKLEQHVDRFNEWIGRHAGAGEGAEARLKAQILGRWPDGVSLVRQPASPDYVPAPDANAPHQPQINDFTYRRDRGGLACPLGAHVRRANPRDALGFHTERTRRNRIIRRGMPYADDNGSRGLIFVCFNANITRQFEQIQGQWLMSGDTFGLGSERDFLTGGLDPGQAAERMTLQGDKRRPPRFITRDRQFVTVRGGHYLFVPGIAALRRIARG